jgi:dipeptidyl aminopeptidase/acylaminoacyl peptidase
MTWPLLTGGSYGGYLTLQALGRRPDLWAGGMAQVAIADWALMYEDEAETLRGYQRSLFGGAPEEIPEQTRISSPITYAADLRAPILVIQGENDTRCPARQMKVYEARLREMDKDIQVHWFDAGHGSRAMEQQIEHQAIMLRWAYRVLG